MSGPDVSIFPNFIYCIPSGSSGGPPGGGLSKRELFAGLALAAVQVSGQVHPNDYQGMCLAAIQLADELMRQLEAAK